MRRLTAFQASLALLFALFIAPYQHVHQGQCEGQGTQGVFDSTTVVHVHPFVFSHVHADAVTVPLRRDGSTTIGEASEEHASWLLNSFSLVLHSASLPVIQPKSAVIPVISAESFTTIEIVEERVHDPPSIDCSVPRAPPA
jgi:hypothetical protein